MATKKKTTVQAGTAAVPVATPATTDINPLLAKGVAEVLEAVVKGKEGGKVIPPPAAPAKLPPRRPEPPGDFKVVGTKVSWIGNHDTYRIMVEKAEAEEIIFGPGTEDNCNQVVLNQYTELWSEIRKHGHGKYKICVQGRKDGVWSDWGNCEFEYGPKEIPRPAQTPTPPKSEGSREQDRSEKIPAKTPEQSALKGRGLGVVIGVIGVLSIILMIGVVWLGVQIKKIGSGNGNVVEHAGKTPQAPPLPTATPKAPPLPPESAVTSPVQAIAKPVATVPGDNNLITVNDNRGSDLTINLNGPYRVGGGRIKLQNQGVSVVVDEDGGQPPEHADKVENLLPSDCCEMIGISELKVEKTVRSGNGTRFRIPSGWNMDALVHDLTMSQFNSWVNKGTVENPQWMKPKIREEERNMRVKECWFKSKDESDLRITFTLTPYR